MLLNNIYRYIVKSYNIGNIIRRLGDLTSGNLYKNDIEMLKGMLYSIPMKKEYVINSKVFDNQTNYINFIDLTASNISPAEKLDLMKANTTYSANSISDDILTINFYSCCQQLCHILEVKFKDKVIYLQDNFSEIRYLNEDNKLYSYLETIDIYCNSRIEEIEDFILKTFEDIRNISIYAEEEEERLKKEYFNSKMETDINKYLEN